MRRFVGLTLLCGTLALSFSTTARAQISGVVKDAQTGTPLPGAKVSVHATHVETHTDDTGAFSLPEVTGLKVISGAVKSYFTGSVSVQAPSSDVEILLEAIPLDDSATYELKGPTYCGQCHSQQVAEWNHSAMAHAGTNSWVYDTYNGTGTDGGMGGFVYTRDSFMKDTHVASECRACHQPAAWVQEPFTALGDLSSPTPAMQDGVSCDVCHKIADIDETKTNYPGIYPGVVRLTRPAGNWQVQYGTLGDVNYSAPGQMRPAYNPQLKAAVCAACHQDKNDPDGDGDFEEDNGVVSEPTYQEWLASPYADPSAPQYATCVDCHMEPTYASQACHVLFTAFPRPAGDVRSHRFPGTTPQFLENAVTLTMEARLEDGELRADVTVLNDQTGHHVPTGVTIRNMILLVEAWDGAEVPLTSVGTQQVHELGGVGSPALGYYAGLPGKLYAKVNHAADMSSPVFYTEATGVVFDNRIGPLASDTTHHAFRVPATAGMVKVRARLIYRRSWRALVDAKNWTTDGHGAPLEDVAAPHFGHLMEQVEATYALAACDGGPCGCVHDADCPPNHACTSQLCVPLPAPDGGPGSSSSSGTSSTSTSGSASSSSSSSSGASSAGGASSSSFGGASTSGASSDAGKSNPDGSAPRGGCGCHGAGGSASIFMLLAALLCGLSRRRGGTSCC
ncbi:MAG: carboxypeptidase-like regulatory domain-containing protein [Myxococcota bacterium]